MYTDTRPAGIEGGGIGISSHFGLWMQGRVSVFGHENTDYKNQESWIMKILIIISLVKVNGGVVAQGNTIGIISS